MFHDLYQETQEAQRNLLQETHHNLDQEQHQDSAKGTLNLNYLFAHTMEFVYVVYLEESAQSPQPAARWALHRYLS